MKKSVWIGLSASALCLTLAGCGATSGRSSSSSGTTGGSANNSATSSGSSSNSATSGDSSSNSSSSATGNSGNAIAASATNGKTVKVAFVYNGPANDGGWTSAQNAGRKYLDKTLGIDAKYVENVPETADSERTFEQLAQQGYNVIFGTSYGFMNYMADVAPKYPNVDFINCGGYKTAPNMGTYFGANWQASYLAGIAAGKMTKDNILGYEGAFPIPELAYNINAFTLGAQSVNPKVAVKLVWTNTWYNPSTERQAAISLLNDKADVIAAYQDSPAALEAAQSRGAYAIGNDSDENKFAPKAYITSPVWNWGPYFVKTVKAIQDGTWKSNQFLGNFDDGTVNIAPLGESVPADVKSLVEATKSKLESGQLKVYTGPIYDNTGKLVVKKGQTLTDQQILNMNFLVKGVQGKLSSK